MNIWTLVVCVCEYIKTESLLLTVVRKDRYCGYGRNEGEFQMLKRENGKPSGVKFALSILNECELKMQ